MERRTFLKAFGLTTAATLVKPTQAKLSLFGLDSMDSSLGHHIVLYPRPVFVKREKSQIHARDEVVGRVQGQFPKHKSFVVSPYTGPIYNLCQPYNQSLQYVHKSILPGQDPHIVFYRAAEKLRKQFAQESLDQIQAVPKDLRPVMQLVTVLHEPISVVGGGFHVGSDLTIRCHYETRLVLDPDLSGWDTHSRFGALPVELPSDIQIRKLIQYDKDIVMRTGEGWKKYQAS